MARRHKMGRSHSKHHFTKHASHIHRKNLPQTGTMVMRGGIRM